MSKRFIIYSSKRMRYRTHKNKCNIQSTDIVTSLLRYVQNSSIENIWSRNSKRYLRLYVANCDGGTRAEGPSKLSQ